MKRSLKRSINKAISLLLVSVMLLSTLPLNVLAQELNNPDGREQVVAANALVQGLNNPNTRDQVISELTDKYGTEAAVAMVESIDQGLYNQNAKEQLIAQLSEQYGTETADEMVESMISMGILDENGNRLTYKIEMDDQLYTLDQMRDIVNAPDVDLDKEVKVDDQVVTLAYIAKLIDFETYMEFVEESFLKNNVKVTDEHSKMLADLENQLKTEGISIVEDTPEPAITETAIPEPAAAVEAMFSAAAVATVPVVTCSAVANPTTNKATVTYTLTQIDALTASDTVTFSQEYLPGILGANTNTLDPVVSLTKSYPSKVVTINLPITASERWKGNAAIGYLRLTDLNGGLFSNQKSSQLVPIKMSKTYDYTQWLYGQPQPNLSPDYSNGMGIGPGQVEGYLFCDKEVTDRWYNKIPPGLIPLKKYETTDGVQIDPGDYNIITTGLLGGVKLLPMPESVRNAFLDNAATKIDYRAVIYYNSGWGYPAKVSWSLGKNLDLTTFKFNDQFPKNASGVFTPFISTTTSDTKKAFTIDVPINFSEAERQIIAQPTDLWLTLSVDDYVSFFYTTSVVARDDEYPTVKTISSPNKTFKAGEQVPIVVTFSEPIVEQGVGKELILTMQDDKGVKYTVKSTTNSPVLTHSKVTFMFDVPPQVPAILWPVSVSSGAVDTIGKKTYSAYNFPINAGTQKTTPLATTFDYNEIDSITGFTLKHADGTALTGAYAASETKGKLEVNLFQNPEVIEGTLTIGKKQNNWLISYTDPVADGITVKRLKASFDNGKTLIPLYITDAVDKLTAEFTLPDSGDHKMLLYMATDDTYTKFRPILEANKSVEFTKAALIHATAAEMTINHPPSMVLNLGDEQLAKLEYTYNGNATFQSAEDFKWVSNNPDIAEISATTGEITPIAVGKVTFNLVAMNGTDDVSKHVSKTSEEFTVKVYLGKPSLAVSKFITTKMGMPVQVMWSTNVIYINQQAEPPKDTSFTVELYEGNYADVAALAGKTTSYTGNSAVNANSFSIPGEQLTLLSSGKEPAYTVKISTLSPYVSGEKVETVGNIIVGSPPANVKIVRPASYYMLDTAQPLSVNWASTNVNNTPGGHDFAFAVTKNGASVTTNQAASGSYTLDFADVTGNLKDVYTVTAKIKNTDDDAYSYDSFVLHVYDADAMKIWVDKQDASSIIMDNAGGISGKTSADIVALERNISLTNKLSINYGDYSYGLVTDQVEWKSSDSQAASINYSQGGGYNNIEDYDFPSYMPDANFILAGLKDGTATINATHKLSKMTDTLGVEVKTLKDKLYLFQAMPMATTEFIYTNGDNEKKTVNSDPKGAVAIYEPKGIKGNVLLKSIVGDSIYMGTIYEVNLLSGENDGSKGQLYPINNFVLRKAAQLDLNFKKLDGTPYTGTVTIRGGVYKNGNYCEASEISDNVGAWKEPDLITPAKGFHMHGFDVNNFWSQEAGETSASSVVATDIIDYVFEFHFGNDEYQPQIMKFSGNLSGADVLRFGESIVTLEPIVEKNKPFFSAQYLDRFKKSGRLDSIKNATGNIGLNAQTPKVRIDTQALWWGAPFTDTNSAISILNEKGVALAGQNYKTFKYPFATMLLTEHQMMIDGSNIWIGKKGRGKLTVKLFNEDGSLYNSTLQAYSIRNMLPVENISASPEVNANFQAEMQNSIKAGTSFDAKDKFTQAALDFVSGIKFGNENFSLMLAPTADPTVFKGLLQLNAGDDVMDMGPKEDGFSLMLDDDEVDTNGKGKAAFAKSQELVSGLIDDFDIVLDESSSFKYQVGGYFSCKIIYNFDEDKWEIRPIGGGIRAGIGYNYTYTGNAMAGPVPCTYEIALGAAVRLEFDAHMLYEPVSVEYPDKTIDYWWQEDKESATDYLTNLRIKAYIYAFGGMGIDYTIIALKVGVFGQLVLENENKFLNRNYLDEELATEKALSGSRLSLAGQVGIKFVAKLLFISYQATLASAQFEKEWVYRNWDKIEQYWEETTGDMLTMQNMSLAAQSYAAATGQDSVVITEAPALESRSYLDDYARVWSTPSGKMSVMSLDIDNLAPSTLQSNAYPYANPLIADDGTMFVYLSDNGSPEVWDTTANYAVKESGIYVEKGKINTEASFGDSQLSFASNNSQAISAWVRLTEKLTKNAGDTLTAPEMAMMINNTEVYASIYKGSAWTTEKLTSNSTPDMAPAVATNGSQAIVAWRSVYAGDASNPTDFSGKDTIVYRLYDGSQWSQETKTLYNGVNGSVLGLKAAMNADGTAAIAYVIDTSGTRDANSYEIVYGVVGSSAEIVNNVRLTNDTTADQNPQLTVAKFGDGVNPDERFVLGWYNLDGEKADIRLATFGNDGSPKEDFIDSLSSVSSGNNVGGNFKFVNTSAANKDFKNLSVLWVEPDASTGSDSLKAIKFVQETVDGTELTFTSAAVDVAEMPAKTIIDSFDAYVSNAANDEVKVVILGTETKNEFDTIISDGNTIMVPKTESKMFTATETYQNKAKITAADFNFTEIMAGFIMPIAFTVQNLGKDLITSVTIEYGTESKTFNNLKILPGTSNTLLVNYGVPENIVDLSYSGTATFGDSTIDMTGNGTLPLAVADLGISKISTVKEQDGEREFAVTLYNSSDYKLSGSSGKTVKLGIYDSSAYILGTEVVPMVTISDADELFLIDNGAYTTNLSFDIKAYLSGIGKSEIPANGVTLYAKAWVVDSSDEKQELAEFVGENNFSTILCENLVQRNGGNSIKVDVKQSNSATETTAVLTLQNLAMAAVTNGNVAVNLLDEGSNIIKTQYLSNTAEGLVALGSEAVINKTFVFDTLGADVEAYYFNATADSMNADLQLLAASGVGVGFDKDTTTYENLTVSGLESTNITAISANPNAKVLLKDASNTVLGEETGALAYTLPLVAGDNTFTVTVEPDGAGAQPKTYALTVENAAPASGSVTLTTSVPDIRGWWNISSIPVTLTTTELANFTPTKMQYKVNYGAWTDKDYTSSPIEVTDITAEGTHVISAKLQDVNGYNLTANSLTVKMDRTAPAFVPEKTSAMLAGNTVSVSADVYDALNSIYSVVMTRDSVTYAMQKQAGTDTYTANITASRIGAITIAATDMAGNTAQIATGIPDSVLASITTPTPITGIAYGTAKTVEALGLPPTVTMVTDKGNVNASVTWDVDASSYDVARTTEQTFTVNGTVTLPEGVVNTGNVALTTSIGVTVKGAPVLASITTPTAVAGIAYGTAKTAAALGLPLTVTMVTDQGNVNASVTWDVYNSSYDVATTTEQIFTVNGTVTLPERVVNTDNVALTTSIDVTVKGAVVLASITTPTAIAGIANGAAKTAEALGLPTMVTMVTNQGNVSASVTWDVDASSYDIATTTEQTFTIHGTVTLPEGVVNTGNVALTTNIDVTVKGAPVLASITTPTAITGIAYGTAKTAAALGLPTIVTMVTDQGNVSASVTWDVYNSSYDVATTTEQTFTVHGAVYLPEGVANTDNVGLTTTINVTVNGEVLIDKVLVSITTPTAIDGIVNGTGKTAAALGLPTTVTMVTDQGNVNAGVTWDVDASSYDVAKTTEQTFNVQGTVTLPEGVVNTDNVSLETSINVIVNAVVLIDKVLVSITTPTAIDGIANGTAKTAAALGLPTIVTMVTDQGTVSASVTWDVNNSSYDVATTTEQTFTVQGTVTLPGGVVNTNNVDLTTSIGVTVSAYATTRGGGGGNDDVTKTDIIKTTDSTNNVRLTATEINKAKTLTVNGDGANLIFGEDILTEIKIKSSMEVTIKTVKAEELSEEARAIVGDRPVFDIKVIADGKAISNGKLYIELPYTPKEGEDTSKLAAFYIADDGTITQMAGSRYDSVKKAIVFTTTHLSVYAVGEIKDIVANSKFADVVKGSWAESYIYYLADRGIVNGKTETTFAPNASITRSEFVTILAKMSGNTLPQGTDEFSDVPVKAWYAPYVAWASQMDVAKGFGGSFHPNDVITRQDMAAMIARYAENVTNYSLPESNVTQTFADDAKIAGYAKSAVYAMQQAGIISGRGDNTFAPTANASRAEAAKMIAVLLQGMSK